MTSYHEPVFGQGVWGDTDDQAGTEGPVQEAAWDDWDENPWPSSDFAPPVVARQRWAEQRQKTQHFLAMALLVILSLCVLAQYWAVFWIAMNPWVGIEDKKEAFEILGDALKVAVPGLTGLIGAATAFYFTRDKS